MYKEKRCMYGMGLTTDVRAAEVGKDSVFELPRLDCNDFPPKSENYKIY